MRDLKLGCLRLAIMIAILGFAFSANADLWVDNSRGLVYDSDLNITWLQDANYAFTSGYDSDGKMSFNDARIWAENLSYSGYSDWRLPVIPSNAIDISNCSDFAPCQESEIGHIYHTELGNTDIWYSNNETGEYYPISHTPETGPFVNMYGEAYHFGNEEPSPAGPIMWAYLMDLGLINSHRTPSVEFYSLVVRDGNSGITGTIVPEPISSILFIAGGTLLAGRRYIKRGKTA